MLAQRQSRERFAAVRAGTVFALTLALVAGLVLATMVKLFVWDRKPQPVAEAPRYKVTVAAVNILDKQQVTQAHLKTVTVPREKYDEYLKLAKEMGTKLLEGNQPLNRTTLKPIPAEEPLFENQFEPLGYPESVKERLAEGKRAVLIEVPARAAMVQVGDVVDVLCTVSNRTPAFGGDNGSATATMAKNLRVIARFNTTRTAATPPPGEYRSYTLEVDPWQFAAIELAKSVGGVFALSVESKAGGAPPDAVLGASTGPVEESPSKIVEARFNTTGRVTVADLATLFGIDDQPVAFRMERLAGNSRLAPVEYSVRQRRRDDRPTPGGVRPASGPGGSQKSVPPSPGKDGVKSSSLAPQNSSNSVATDNMGFQPVAAASSSSECKNCAKKR